MVVHMIYTAVGVLPVRDTVRIDPFPFIEDMIYLLDVVVKGQGYPFA